MANSIAAVLPQFWALEGLRRLMELTPAVASVNRQFADDIRSAGDTVNAWRADRRVVRRKTRDDEYIATDANITPVPVKLDQYFFDTIVIKDEEEALSIPELTRTHLMPMIEAIARGMDRSVLGRIHSFLKQGQPLKRAGRLNKISVDNAGDFILEAEEVLLGNLAPMEGLWTAIVHHTANTKLMGTSVFQRSNERGANGTVLTGEVGIVYNTRVLVSQNVNYVYAPTSDIQTAGAVGATPYAAGTTGVLVVTDPGTDWSVGEYVVLDGNDQPTYLTATASATSITLNEELKYAVIAAAPITHFLKGANEAVERLAGYQKEMKFTHTAAKNYQVGQLISFGTTTRQTYTIIEVVSVTSTTTTVLLDRPLDATVASAADCFPGPHGSMNPVMHKDAIAFVSRNMRVPEGRDGANGAVQNFGGIGLRIVTQYDSKVGGTRVNVDVLAGISVLDEDLLVVMCA